jgi:hypothetical protein
MAFEFPKTLTVDGVEHPVADFSETVQRLISIHTSWKNELATERLAVAKTEAAVRCLDAELSQFVKSELEAAADSALKADDTVTTLKPVKKEPKKKA